MGHIDRGAADALVQADELAAHLHPQQRVQIGQRLVHQEGERLAHDRAAQRHALALAAGELVGILVELLPS